MPRGNGSSLIIRYRVSLFLRAATGLPPREMLSPGGPSICRSTDTLRPSLNSTSRPHGIMPSSPSPCSCAQVTRTGQVMRPGTTSASSRKYELSDSSGGDGTDHAALPDNNSVRRTHTQTQQPGRIALNAKTAASPGARLQVAGRSPAAASKRLSGGGSSIGIRQSPATTGSASKVPRALVLDDTEDLEDLEPSPAKRPKNKSPPTGGGRLGNSDTSAGKRCETDDAHGELALDQSSNNNAPAAALSEDGLAAGL